MKLRNYVISAVIALSLMPGMALATNTVLSGVFDGSESKTAPLPGGCASSEDLKYQVSQPWQVSASGAYFVVDANNWTNVDIIALIYRGSFDPDFPQVNLETPNGVDVAEMVNLSAGTNYVLVVQHWCGAREGTWTVTFSGPGSLNSNLAVMVPAMTMGGFTGSDPVTSTDCGNSQYQQVGPVQVGKSGKYYYTDISIIYDVDMCLQVYSEPFDPENPSANRVGHILEDFGTVELEAGRDYWFVAQPELQEKDGQFLYIFAPPAPFRINYAMSGSWFYPETNGQGFFMDIFDDLNQLFLAWFTFDLQRPSPGMNAMIGDPGHRWMTATGPFDGNQAEAPIYWTSGMIFDSATPPRDEPILQEGHMTIEFFDCETGLVTYDLGSSGAQSQVPIQRPALDAVPLCKSLAEGPGKPGPL